MSNPTRSEILRNILVKGNAATQEEIAFELNRQGHDTTQSTISRSLRKLGAIRTLDENGRTVYRLGPQESTPPSLRNSLSDLVTTIQSNLSIVVIHTTPGSASLVARHLDHFKPGGILGTIAGDDTVFVAPSAAESMDKTISAIRQSLTRNP
jgi:transcriptional regulator of arginine metabolism